MKKVILTAWAGSLWTICGLVVPLLFVTLDDRRLAGNIATTFFYAETWLGAILGVVFLILQRRNSALDSKTGWLAGMTLAAPLLFYVLLRPMMNAARATGDMTRFGLLHSAASVLFLIACVGALLLVIREPLTSRAQ